MCAGLARETENARRSDWESSKVPVNSVRDREFGCLFSAETTTASCKPLTPMCEAPRGPVDAPNEDAA